MDWCIYSYFSRGIIGLIWKNPDDIMASRTEFEAGAFQDIIFADGQKWC